MSRDRPGTGRNHEATVCLIHRVARFAAGARQIAGQATLLQNGGYQFTGLSSTLIDLVESARANASA